MPGAGCRASRSYKAKHGQSGRQTATEMGVYLRERGTPAQAHTASLTTSEVVGRGTLSTLQPAVALTRRSGQENGVAGPGIRREGQGL